MKTIYIGFKGKNNTSCRLVRELTSDGYFLTNSFHGLRKDLEAIPDDTERVYMFGVDKRLNGEIRIEASAEKDGEKLYSTLDLPHISEQFRKNGLSHSIADQPAPSLCNEAYWYALKRFRCNVVFIHIPSIGHYDALLHSSIKSVLR